MGIFFHFCRRGGTFDGIKPIITAQIAHVESSVSIRAESQAPALIGEWLPIKLCVSTKDDISDVSLSMKILTDVNGTGNANGSATVDNSDQTSML